MGGGGKGRDVDRASPESKPGPGGGGGGGGKGGASEVASSVSDFDDDATLLAEVSGKGILGPEFIAEQKSKRASG